MPAKAAKIIPFRKKIHSLSFFSGAMGLDLGLEAEGIEPLLVSEIDKSCIATIRRNKPDLNVIGDIREYTPAQIRKAAGLGARDEIDLVVGGPPCQPFSTAGKRLSFEDIRGNVFLNFIEMIIQLKPKLAVIENVRGLLSAPLIHRPHQQRGRGFAPLTPEEMPGGALWFALNMLRTAKYGVSFNLYNAANFGAPQKRERVILIASRDGVSLPYLEPTHSKDGLMNLPRWRTVRQAIGKLKIKEHDFVKFPEKRLKYYRLLKAGQYWKHLPEHLQKEALGASYYAGGGKTGFLRRLPWDEASPTLVTHPAMPATDLAHPEEDRPLSVQEYKKLQEFPDSWHIEGKLLDQYRQVGNAVPISLGRAVGRHVMKYLNNEKFVVQTGFEYSRYKMTDHISWERNYLKTIEADKQSVLFA
ncbi:DNA cytosine methyltransferase [Turneriella parva]|uniref:Cytosine-specific methyltransferase n=1 Tax=Turneriella parva (strain ATCC BAA-1111 / DSM 21527 / NCTC 11395 / H) TaxID=869212 RepID=I4B1N0_TURPD|nr:DNA cytosine methyltransferase [Turneriella parva]AFM11187.1 DNA-cytosine methyltransferase [Turneriella parva DSM 21527]